MANMGVCIYILRIYTSNIIIAIIKYNLFRTMNNRRFRRQGSKVSVSKVKIIPS